MIFYEIRQENITEQSTETFDGVEFFLTRSVMQLLIIKTDGRPTTSCAFFLLHNISTRGTVTDFFIYSR